MPILGTDLVTDSFRQPENLMLALAQHFDELITTPEGDYRARVCAQLQEDGRWGAWIVFVPTAGGRSISTDRETTQSNLADLIYWASGLTPVYLQGALRRALALQAEAQVARRLDATEPLEGPADPPT